ncbi:MAG: DUF3808 domain-containing protein [bacterium]|uniref:Uncharacterized protein n=2 Tax=Bacteria candidate phyla TaxID=1783234 RepID=A0A101I377_UNCT6|nr:MAG: hypothetical protein XD76_0042 [candidate division TA06 bacterium 32_111]KUK88142.1 MAG: hypothetical protein XE03_0148 [candidate division TA06 bacterium 34_109]MDI6700943.1 DUF3808 domain-containing protein [bacterium]HAF07072.1 hypothetical protein [candidate division WOR-3 bacterium]HCP16987.1 hypothetical protein [candidate division WOR-3 bacterium]
MKKFILIVSLSFFTISIFPYPAYKEDVDTIVDLLYKQDYEKAIKHIESIKKKYSPVLYHFLNATVISTYMSDFETDSLSYLLFSSADSVLKYADLKDSYDNFFVGGVFLYKTYYYVDKGNYPKVINNGLSALKFFNRSIDIDKTMYDSYLGKGVVSYFVNRFKDRLPFVSGNDDGIKLIKFSADSGIFVQYPAYNVLAVLYQLDKNYKEAEKTCERLREVYPDNRMFLFTHIKILLEQDKFKEALLLLEKLKEKVETEQPKTYVNLSFVYYNLSLVYTELKDFENAKLYLRKLNRVYMLSPHNKKVKEFYRKGEILKKRIDG